MDKIKKNLNSIGLGLLFLAVVALRVWPAHKFIAIALAILGAGAIGAYIAMNVSDLKQGLKRRSFIYSSNMLLVVVLVLAILVLVNYFFSEHHHRFDFTEAKIHSLSDQSIKVIGALRNDVNIKAFFREGNMSRSRMEDLLKIFAYHTPKIKYEFIDPDKNPGLVKRYEISQDGTTVFECGDKDNRITGTTEEDVTNAIIKVTREKKKVIYFLEGHGERSTEVSDENGYSFVKDELGKIGYEVKKQQLALAENFPKDCALLVIPGPDKDLLPNELETITKYIEGGGRVFFMVDPQSASGLIPYLAKFGFKLGNDVIVDRYSTLLGGDYFMPLMAEYEYHDVTKNFRYATFYPVAQTVDVIDPKPENVMTSQVLGRTSPSSWAKQNLSLKGKYTLKEIGFDEKKDKAGPLPLAAVATIKAKAEAGMEAAPQASREGRLAVFGDSDFASNRYYNMSGNGNLFMNVVNWLTEESDLISIMPKTSNPRTIQLSPSQGRMIFWISVIILPLAVLVLGISIWVRRRSL
jgi:ABC-type uncharacterized transport system involved in gliding motility auxiliary subunit